MMMAEKCCGDQGLAIGEGPNTINMSKGELIAYLLPGQVFHQWKDGLAATIEDLQFGAGASIHKSPRKDARPPHCETLNPTSQTAK